MDLFVTTEGAGPDLVLVHGWGLHSGVFDALAAELAQRFRVTRVDLPGHGRSAACTMSAALEKLAAQIGARVPSPAIWLGWSLGGLLAMQRAVVAPETVQALWLIASVPRFVRGADWPHGVEPGVLQQFARDLDTDYAGTLARFLALQVRGSVEAGATLRALRARLLEHGAPTPAALHIGLELLRDTDLRAQLVAIRCPTLFLFGERDVLAPPASVDGLRECMPAARSLTIAGAGHAPFLSHRAACLAALESWPHD